MKNLPSNLTNKIYESFKNAKEVKDLRSSVVFNWGVVPKEFQIEIYLSDEGDWNATLTHLDSAYEQEIMWREENNVGDLFHEIRTYIIAF